MLLFFLPPWSGEGELRSTLRAACKTFFCSWVPQHTLPSFANLQSPSDLTLDSEIRWPMHLTHVFTAHIYFSALCLWLTAVTLSLGNSSSATTPTVK